MLDKNYSTLSPRLAAVVRIVLRFRPTSHADIGTDHGYLPAELHRAGVCSRLVATELSRAEFQKAKGALAHLKGVTVLQGDGLEPILDAPVESLSLCGMGGHKMAEILEAHPSAVPDLVIVQPNRDAWRLRQWGLEGGFHLESEQLVPGRFLYPVLSLVRGAGPDPAYRLLPREVAVRFGPLLLGRRDPRLVADLERRWRRFSSLPDSRERRLLERARELVKLAPSS